MIEIKFYFVFITALIPLVIGYIWYNPKVFGTAWMKETGLTEDNMKEANMPLILGLSYVFSVFIASALLGMTIHQLGLQSLVLGEKESTLELAKQLMGLTENNYRTFGHGALHGLLGGVFIAFSILATNALFERKSWKYIWINAGYWILSMTLMGGVICQFS